KPDSQDVCFITSTGGRQAFLGDRIPMRPGRLVDHETGAEVGTIPAVELVTVGQRRGMGVGGNRERRYAVDVDLPNATVTVGALADVSTDRVAVASTAWASEEPAPGTPVLVQSSAHGRPAPAVWDGDGVRFDQPQRRVAPGQSVVLYDGDEVLGGGVAVRST
ncbi:MAG TPA: aminomethyltransferase beta-barrel domain-containing protein, partial [Acidimicrobiales bacterium]